MARIATSRRRPRVIFAIPVALIFAIPLVLILVLAFPALALANVTLTRISNDPYTAATCTASTTTYHHTEVEPDTFSNGSTIVAAFQVARIFDGGACDIGFATSTNNGSTWTHGLLPGITKFQGGGPFDRVSDPSVAFDAKHAVWLIASLALSETGGAHGAGVLASRSTNGGLTWSNPVTINPTSGVDKDWIACDNTSTSSFYGHCYAEWDNNAAGNLLQMSTSSDGGQTWGAATTNGSGVIGGQPLVRPDGTVIVPTDDASEVAVGAFHSTNGGSTWSAITTIASISSHTEAGGLRSGPLPPAEIDGAGTVYVAWSDCRFRSGCSANDIVLSHSLNSTGTSWSAVSRVPIDATTSGVDHFIPGLAVNKGTSGASAQLGLTYYDYPKSACGGSCVLDVGFISSSDGGNTWGTPVALAGPFAVTRLANTSQGRMVGDYISTSYGSNNLAHGAFMTASAPSTGSTCGAVTDNCRESAHTPATGLSTPGGHLSSAGDHVVYGGVADNGHLWDLAHGNAGKKQQ
jgi:hypothetical protein